MNKKKLLTLGITMFTLMGGIIFYPSDSYVNAASKDAVVQSLAERESIGRVHHEVETWDDLQILASAWTKYMKTHPNASEKKQEAFLNNFKKQQGFSTITCVRASGVGDYLPGYNNLNSAERKLAKKHPVQAVKVYLCAEQATNLTIEYYGTNGWQDNSDAFRHCCWNALMKKSIGKDAATEWATAHEAESSGIDKQMDLYNNNIGRGISVSGKSNAQIAKTVKSKVKNGNCKRIKNNKLVKTDGTGLKK